MEEKLREGVDRLCEWFAGDTAPDRRNPGGVLVEPGGDVDPVLAAGLVAPGAWLFAEDADGGGTGVPGISVGGGLAHPGDELSVADEVYVQTFDYCSLPYLSIAGPTVVRITGEADHAAFLADADRAAHGGVWAAALGHSSVHPADIGALAAPARRPGTGRLYVTTDGTVRTGIGGSDLARVEDGAEAVAMALAAHGGDPTLDGVLERSVLLAGAASRPWLGRYLRALDVRRRLAGRFGGEPTVSGFGVRLTPGLPTAPVEAVDAPLITEHDGTCYAGPADGSRLFRLGRDSARLLEVFAVLDEAEQAAAEAARLFQVTPSRAAELHADLTARLGGSGSLARAEGDR
ncbi:daptide biosynthesis RiPP recognition protein [Kitasatospora sp. NPDC057904]|uniref:daptide biosynthesis RiPP recognition protein n=1 Tax=Kitasatospora sp. NPDC057904 TaxID=3346275 RepID=UPI0036DC2E6F